MYIKEEYDFNDLLNRCWQGAVDTLETISNNNKESEFMNLLMLEFSNVPTITEVNDFLWFEDNYIFKELKIKGDEEDETDE